MKRQLLAAGLALTMVGCSSGGTQQVETSLATSSAPVVEVEPVVPAESVAVSPPQDADALEIVSLAPPEEPPAFVHPVAAPKPIDLGDEDASVSFDFTARELYSGSSIEGEDLFGQGAVVVTFVQPGCEISIDGGPELAAVAERYPEAIYVIVHSGASDEEYIQFAEEAELFGENMVHLSDTYGSLSARYGVVDYPTTLLIDSVRRISSVTGAMDADAQVQAAESVIDGSV